jgi:aminopeptidase N
VLAGGYKGLRYETHDGGQPVIASLSTPYLAHTWWPCKDGTGDKADSTFIDITIADTIIGGLQVIAVSNGILENTISANGKKTFQWRHRYPIVPYYVMVAISNYTHFQQTFIGLGYTFPIDYYVFQSHLADAQNGVAPLPGAMALFTELFGPYPFREEKYGMTQLGYYGGIENQTNSIINKMNQDWFYVSVHELAHMWFADMITCDTWHHGWLNEGFASYAEALYAEHAGGTPAYRNYMTTFEFYNAGTLYMPDVSNPFTVFQSIIYDKGAYVLHMLRGILGDDLFFETLHSYATDANFQYDHATTEDLQTTCEQVSGLDLDYFFEEWIYDERYPQYRFNYSYDPAEELLHLWIVQTQGELGWREVFEMPVQVRATFTDGTDTTVTVFNDAQTQYFHFSFEKEVNLVELDPDKWILREVQYDPDISVGVRDLDELQVQVFPNPTSGAFTVVLPSGIGENSELLLFDFQGRRLFQQYIPSWHGEKEIRINKLEKGIYFLQLRSGKASYQKRIVVLHGDL